MNIKDLRPASEFAQRYGAKAICYGPPSGGKTPAVKTAPRPVLCAIEPGMMSLRDSNVPTYGADTPARIDEFFKWACESNETKNFDTIAIDSISQMAEVYLADELIKEKHGLKAYGNMAEKVMKHLTSLYFMQGKHTYLICKEALVEVGNSTMRRPYFPGKEINTKIPHLYDLILHLAVQDIPGSGQHKAFLTASTYNTLARDRSGSLNAYEPPALDALFSKACGQ